MEQKAQTKEQVIGQLMNKKAQLIAQRDAEVQRLNKLAPEAKTGAKYELMPNLNAQQLETGKPIIAMQNLMKKSVLDGAVQAGIIRKIASAKVDNKQYELFNKLTTEIKQISKQILDAELGTAPKKAGSGGIRQPVTDDTIKAKNKKWFESLNGKKVAQYQITYDPAKGTLNSKFNNSPQRYPDMVEKAMVKAGIAADRHNVLVHLRSA